MAEYQVDNFQVKALKNLKEPEAGGKAKGLAELMDAGLNVPEGFVVLPRFSSTGEHPGDYAKDDALDKTGFLPVLEAYNEMGGGPVAVRSSAINEDGEEFSAAGQYESFLRVEGDEALMEAVEKCLRSAESSRVKSYREAMDLSGKEMGRSGEAAVSKEVPMAVIVQRMVEPAKAGVLFTIHPVTGDRNEVIIEAVSGSGDLLVSGTKKGIRYTLPRDAGSAAERGEKTVSSPSQDGLLTGADINTLITEALEAEAKLGVPLDMEWAMDSSGTLHWLQARTITTLVDDSLDTRVGDDEYITRCNIGEMLPGAATPLTLSVFAEPLDWGLREMSRREGVLRGLKEPPRYIHHVENHLFMSLSAMYLMARRVAGANREGTELNVVGRILPDHDIGPEDPKLLQIINGFRYAGILFRHNRYLKKITDLAKRFVIDLEGRTAGDLYRDLCVLQESVLNKAYFYHYCVSAFSGAMNAILAVTLAGGGEVDVEAHSRMGLLLTDIPDIESAKILSEINGISRAIHEAGHAQWCVTSPEEQVLSWLRSDKAGPAGTLFREFLERHGHRCIREAELRSKDYETYPEEVVKIIRDSVKSLVNTIDGPSGPAGNGAEHGVPQKRGGTAPVQSGDEKKVSPWLLKQAKTGVRQREYSKSMLILAQHQFKKGYRKLAEILAAEKIIPEEDLIYFFTREEIGDLIDNKRRKPLIRLAKRRRQELPYKMDLIFPEISKGKPKPLENMGLSHEEKRKPGGAVLSGTPVSIGVVEGHVRIVKHLDDAYHLKPGEIMVAPFTDIGWTPFFSSISGLITEVGGALSHGAVVAREYGIPMVSNISGVLNMLETGTKVRLDGKAGTVRVLNHT